MPGEWNPLDAHLAVQCLRIEEPKRTDHLDTDRQPAFLDQVTSCAKHFGKSPDQLRCRGDFERQTAAGGPAGSTQ